MTDLNDLKIQTFFGINDSPIAPTASKAGNGSHFIKKFNDLIDSLPSPDSLQWKVIKENYQCINRDKLIIDNTVNEIIEIALPLSPAPGDSITLVKALYGGTASISLNGLPFESAGGQSITMNGSREVKFMYVSIERGWIAARSGDALTVTSQEL